MYQQYRKVSENICKLVEISANFNDVNEMIISREKENGLELDEILSKFIFKDWQIGDILLIQDYSVVKPIYDNGTIREMTREEVCATGDLSILLPGEIYENGVIKTIERPQGVKIKWQYPNWVETATLEEQLEYYKQEILKANRELLVYEKAGFTNQELQIKLNELIKKHNEISFDIASEENKFF